MAISFLPNNAFPLPAPLTPTLLALGLDNETTSTVSKIYRSAALNLGEACEREYNRACSAIIATTGDRGSNRELMSKLLTVAIIRYNQAVSKCREEAIGKAEMSLLRKNKKISPQSKVKISRL